MVRVRELSVAQRRLQAALDRCAGSERLHGLAADLLGPGATAWAADTTAGYAGSLPCEVAGMLRSRANTIEGGTTEVNRNIAGERVLGLPREPDPYRDAPWREVPRS